MKNIGFSCITLAVLVCEKRGGRDTWVPKPNIVSESEDLKKFFSWQQESKNEI